MKILFITNLYPPYYIGGYELACQDIAEGLRQRGHDISILTSIYGVNKETEEGNVYRKLYLYRSFHTEKPSAINYNSYEAHNYFVTRSIIGNFNPDIIYLWSLYNLTLAPAVAAQESECKSIYHLFDYHLREYLNPAQL